MTWAKPSLLRWLTLHLKHSSLRGEIAAVTLLANPNLSRGRSAWSGQVGQLGRDHYGSSGWQIWGNLGEWLEALSWLCLAFGLHSLQSLQNIQKHGPLLSSHQFNLSMTAVRLRLQPFTFWQQPSDPFKQSQTWGSLDKVADQIGGRTAKSKQVMIAHGVLAYTTNSLLKSGRRCPLASPRSGCGRTC